MNYLESIAYLESLSPTLEKPTVERIKRFLLAHGSPQNDFYSFHVAGTNGKGSTVAILDSVLRAGNFHVGRFTGPHLLRWNERFHFDGEPISDDDFARYSTDLRTMSEAFGRDFPEVGKLTWFEFITVLAFLYFRDRKVDVAVLEVGLGGRFDATNVLGDKLLCSIITSISLDHTQILGATEELIAAEKAGIIKSGKPVITAARSEALSIIKQKAEQVGAPLFCLSEGDEITFSSNNSSLSSSNASFLVERMNEVVSSVEGSVKQGPLLGDHQRKNALLAFLALFIANFSKEGKFIPLLGSAANVDVKQILNPSALNDSWTKGIENVYWPGRMQRLSDRVVLDGAHNPGGARALRAALDLHFPGKKILFVLSCFDNKDAGGILQTLLRPGDRVFLCEASTKRATFPKDRLLQIARELNANPEIFETVAAAYNAALGESSEQDLIVCTGSFATVRECMQEIGWQSVEDGRVKSGKIDSANLDPANPANSDSVNLDTAKIVRGQIK
jgi:dihydrofolate synthase / folylpolyglutamate synthase